MLAVALLVNESSDVGAVSIIRVGSLDTVHARAPLKACKASKCIGHSEISEPCGNL